MEPMDEQDKNGGKRKRAKKKEREREDGTTC